LYCWRHSSSPPQVGELVESHGQLLWRSTGDCSARQERAIAVLLDGMQLQVREAIAIPRKVELKLDDPSNPAAPSIVAHVALTAVFDALVNGDEQIEASRPA